MVLISSLALYCQDLLALNNLSFILSRLWLAIAFNPVLAQHELIEQEHKRTIILVPSGSFVVKLSYNQGLRLSTTRIVHSRSLSYVKYFARESPWGVVFFSFIGPRSLSEQAKSEKSTRVFLVSFFIRLLALAR